MGSFKRSIEIKAPVASVWEVLADIGSIADWNPGVVRSYVTGDRAGEVGAARHCDLGGKNYLDEEVVEWDEGRLLTIRVVGSNMPFKTADIRFTLSGEGDGTTVTVAPEYSLKGSIVGVLMDTLVVRRMYIRGMESLLSGLKEHVEAAAD
jgi:uncharacterized protein YndB with AHSA1/START domain